jgi:hypothetical protein
MTKVFYLNKLKQFNLKIITIIRDIGVIMGIKVI